MLEWLEQAERLRVLNATDGKIDRVGNLSSVLLFEHLSWAYYIVSFFSHCDALYHSGAKTYMLGNALD